MSPRRTQSHQALLLRPIPAALLAIFAAAPQVASAQDEEIVVTGSRVTRSGFDSPQPVSVIDSQLIDDLGIVNAIQRVYGLRKRPKPDRIRKIAESWRPYRTVACWYLWRSLENQ